MLHFFFLWCLQPFLLSSSVLKYHNIANLSMITNWGSAFSSVDLWLVDTTSVSRPIKLIYLNWLFSTLGITYLWSHCFFSLLFSIRLFLSLNRSELLHHSTRNIYCLHLYPYSPPPVLHRSFSFLFFDVYKLTKFFLLFAQLACRFFKCLFICFLLANATKVFLYYKERLNI